MSSEALEAQQAAELERMSELLAREAEASGASKAALADERIQTPMLAVVQGTTKHPPEGASGGDFVNTVTGANFGTKIEFLVSSFNRGRFYGIRDEDGNLTGESYVAGDEPIVPAYWPEEFRGRVFSELPEAEEMYAEAANNKEIEWGSGPPIATTFNFTGFVLEPSDREDQRIPVRLSLMRSHVPAARKAITMLKPLRNMWDKAVVFSTERVVAPGQVYYRVNAEDYGRAPENPERAAAIELALAAEQIGFNPVGDPEGEAAGSRPDDIEGTAEEVSSDAPGF